MGWQGVDPATDFRSGGLLSLHNLIWLAKHERGVYDRLLRKTDGTRSEWEYPFAAAGVNVTHALCDELQLRPTRRRTSNGGKRVAPEEGQPHASYSPRPTPRRLWRSRTCCVKDVPERRMRLSGCTRRGSRR